MPSRSFPAAALLAALASAGCAATMGGPSPLRSDVDELRVAVDRLRQEQVATRGRLEDLEGGQGPGDSPWTAGQDDQSLRQRLDILQSQLDSMARRTGETEALLAGLQYDIRRLERLLEQMREQGVPGDSTAGVAPDGTAADASAGSGSPETGSPPPSEPAFQPRPPVVGAEDDPAGIFQRAYADYTRGDDELAAMGFRSVLERSPGGPLADDALFYLAEIDAGAGRTDPALAGYARVVEEHPGGDKAPAALLKRGLLLIDENRIGEGVVQLDYLAKTYPASDEARLARNKLRALGVGF